MTDRDLREQINKRLTLNWLIQGAAQHAGMTCHHLIRDELNALDPRLLRLYDQYALINVLQYWHVDGLLVCGSPTRFWRRAAKSRRHPFFPHPLLSTFGGRLAKAGHERALARSREKDLTRLPVVFTYQSALLIGRLKMLEAPHHPRLTELARSSAATVWDVPIDRLDGQVQFKVNLGKSAPARTARGAILRAAVCGYGGVERRGDELVVVGRGTNWQLLTKELVKGTAELICLHGLGDLGDDAYRRVTDATDRLEYEPWMLQTGGELWRQLLPLIPAERRVADVLMHLARLPAERLESLVGTVIDDPDRAREGLAALGDGQG